MTRNFVLMLHFCIYLQLFTILFLMHNAHRWLKWKEHWMYILWRKEADRKNEQSGNKPKSGASKR